MVPAINTAFARQKSAEEESHIAFPAETQSHQRKNLVYDDTDRLEETFSGSGTSHKLN